MEALSKVWPRVIEVKKIYKKVFIFGCCVFFILDIKKKSLPVPAINVHVYYVIFSILLENWCENDDIIVHGNNF